MAERIEYIPVVRRSWRLIQWTACLGVLTLVVWLVADSDALVNLQLHQLNVVFHRFADGRIGLTFKPDITESQVELAIACLERNRESQNVRAIYVFGKGFNSAALHQVLLLHGTESFTASGCDFDDQSTREMTAWKNLERLSACDMKFNPRVLCDLAVLEHLERIEFDGKYLTEEAIKCLSALKHLDLIALSGDDLDFELVGRLKTALPRVTILSDKGMLQE
jgi:hypothetical protein